MAEIKYNEEQIKELEKNKYVKKVSEKYITFTLECKIEFMKLNKKWIFYREIFKKLWFPDYIINSKIPERSYNRWRRNMNKWEIEKKKWRKKQEEDITKMTKDEYIEHLEMKLAVYEELKKYFDWNPP